MTPTSKIFEGIANINIRLKPSEYCREVLKIICENLGYHFGSIILVDEKGIGNLFSSYNLPESYPALVHKAEAPVLSSPSGIAVETGKIVVVYDIMDEPRLKPWHDLLMQFNIKTIAWIPLFSKGKAFGTYTLYDDRQREVSEPEKNILAQLSMLFSMAIISSEYIDEIRQKSIELEKEISERKQVEQRLRMAKDAAEAANLAKNDFLAAMSHELRTPMSAIIGFSDIMLEDESNPEKINNLKIIHESAQTLLSLIDNILDFAEVESGHIDLKINDFSMRNLLNRIYERFLEKAEKKNLFFKIGSEVSAPKWLSGDEYRIEQVVANIVDNALKFTSSGKVGVVYSYHEGVASIRVTDTGIGIGKEKQEAIFSLFCQGDMSPSRTYGGVGLGLTIASRLTATMGGKISCESTPGVGSMFVIELPLREALRPSDL
jgi:signal transduction histidine kinase